MEDDIIDYLKVFNFPSLKAKTKHVDVQEICIEGDEDKISETFTDFGVGNFANHPKIRRIFELCPLKDSLPSTELVLSYLLQYLKENKCTIRNSELYLRNFPSYLCTRLFPSEDYLQKNSCPLQKLKTVGILLQSNLAEEVLCLQHVLNSHFNIIVDITKKELDEQNKYLMTESSASHKRTRRKVIVTEEKDIEPVAKVSEEEPVNDSEEVRKDLSLIEPTLAKTIPVNAIMPSFEARMHLNNGTSQSELVSDSDIEVVGPDVLRPLLPWVQHEQRSISSNKESDLKAVGRFVLQLIILGTKGYLLFIHFCFVW